MLTIIAVGTFIINFSGPASPQRHDPSHRPGHTLTCTPFPEEEPLNYAMAGVNAHVNYDLAMALLDTWEQNPAPPSTNPNDTALREAQHTDYNTINDIF